MFLKLAWNVITDCKFTFIFECYAHISISNQELHNRTKFRPTILFTLHDTKEKIILYFHSIVAL